MNIRQIALDTETTGINKSGPHYIGHRIIEIGAVEIINRRITGQCFHVYLKPDRLIELESFRVHGISDEFLTDKPTFADVADEFLKFISNGELIIHNAPFDVGFIDYEFSMLNSGINNINKFCKVTDSLLLARKIFPSKSNKLDALCNRYSIDNSKRTIHGALLDAEILADIFLLMTNGQTSIDFSMKDLQQQLKINNITKNQQTNITHKTIKVIYANKEELIAHKQRLKNIKMITSRR